MRKRGENIYANTLKEDSNSLRGIKLEIMSHKEDMIHEPSR